MTISITTIEKTLPGDYRTRVRFIKELNDRDQESYELSEVLIYPGEHEVFMRYKRFETKEEGDQEYIKYISGGFNKIDSRTFSPTRIDNDGTILE